MFGLKEYQKLVLKLLSNGFQDSTDWLSSSDPRKLLIRHDIDFSVECAHQLASFEKHLGVYSTYFFMMTSNMYNPLSKQNCELISSIRDMGHKISVHFDPTVYENLNYFEIEKNAFEKIFGVTVDLISIHRPGVFLQNPNIDIAGVKQTYADRFFKEMKYVSDSGGRDITALADNLLIDDSLAGLHLLLHPIWWTDNAINPTQRLNKWRSWNNSFLQSEIRSNCKTYEE